MDYYLPIQSHNQREPLPFQFNGYKLNFLWPLAESAGGFQRHVKRFLISISLLCYAGTILAEFTFMSENGGDIPALTECLTTSFMGLQYIIRISLLAARQQEMHALFKRFYKQIYFTSDDDPELYKQIRTITRFTDFFTRIYAVPIILIYVMFLMDVIQQGMGSQNKPYIYRMSFRWYDAQAVVPYIITSLYTGWLSVSCASLMSAEDYILCVMLCHTSYRFKELQRDLRDILSDARKEVEQGGVDASTDLHRVFRKKLYRVFRRQQHLHSFINEAKSHFTHQIFYCLIFGVLLLCVVLFQFQRTTIGIGWVKYVVWLISQTAEFIMIGYFGQMLMDETTAMQNSYYMCRWEELLPHGNIQTNVLLMGDISFAILNAKQAVVFHGMKFLPLTHSTVGSALRSAMSYFMFLNTMNDSNKSK